MLKFFEAFGVIFGRTISTHFGTVSSLSTIIFTKNQAFISNSQIGEWGSHPRSSSIARTNKQTTNKCGFSTTSNPITLFLAAHRGVRQCTLVCPLPVILSPQCDAIVSTRAVPPFPPVSQSGPSELRGGGRAGGHCPLQFLCYENLLFYPICPRLCHVIYYQGDKKYP